MRKCTKCGEEYPATREFFHKHKNNPGLRPDCKKCFSIAAKARYEKNRDKYLESLKQYRENNAQVIKQRRINYYQKNKEFIKAKSVAYYHETSKKRNAYKVAKRNSEWKKKNKDKVNGYTHKRRAIARNLQATLTSKQWEQIKKDFNYQCAYCGEVKELTQDHFVPISRGGEYTRNNIVPACSSCNPSKGDKDFFDWYPLQDFYSAKREIKILKHLNYAKRNLQQIALTLC